MILVHVSNFSKENTKTGRTIWGATSDIFLGFGIDRTIVHQTDITLTVVTYLKRGQTSC